MRPLTTHALGHIDPSRSLHGLDEQNGETSAQASEGISASLGPGPAAEPEGATEPAGAEPDEPGPGAMDEGGSPAALATADDPAEGWGMGASWWQRTPQPARKIHRASGVG